VWRNGRIDPRISNLDTREVNSYIHASAVLNRRNEPLVLFEYEVWWPSNPAEFGGEEVFYPACRPNRSAATECIASSLL
jgi:hypothetical protein